MPIYIFDAEVESGVIQVPSEYAHKLTSRVRVIVMPEKESVPDKASLFPRLHLDTQGYRFDRDEANAR